MNSRGSIFVRPERESGFTLVELVVMISIIGILAVIVAPRLIGPDIFASRGFYDRAMSVVRHAQKTAIAQRRNVFVVATADRVAACYDAGCTTPVAMSSEFGFTPTMQGVLAKCGNDKTWLCAGAPDGVSLSAAAFSYDGLGHPSAPATVTVTSAVPGDPARQIVVEAETGYVHP